MNKISIFVAFLALSFSVLAANQPSDPGAHKKIKCIDGMHTFDLYLPEAYKSKPAKKFPVLYLSSPGSNPGFRKLDKWANEKEFILICINILVS